MLKIDGQSFAISGSTKVFAIIGDPVVQSLSPAFWNRALQHSSIDAVYIPLRVSEKNIETAFAGLKALNISGINVTMPLKKKIAGFCDILHYPAAEIGAVNTVRFNEKVEGWNTDATGCRKLLTRLRPLKQALVMGNGSSATSVIWALKEQKIDGIFQIARNYESGTEKSTDLIKKLLWNKKNFAYAIKESDIIINTTPLGWKKDDFVIELEEYLDQSKIYVDLNYAPESKLLGAARKNGCTVVDGRELLLQQGLEAFELLTGIECPEQVIRNCLFNQA